MENKAEVILKKIELEKIKPKSRWVFLAKDYLVWGLFLLATLVGAVAMGVIIFIINDNDWDIYRYLERSIWNYFLILMPYFWIIVLGCLSFLAYLNYKHTRKGYLLNPYFVILASVGVSILLGWTLFTLGVSAKIDKMFAQKMPYYMDTDMHKNIFWNNPEKGLLAGEIIEIEDRNLFTVRDLKNNNWKVIGENIIWKDKALGFQGEKIKIIGQIKKDNVFSAKEIRPWGCGCSMCGNSEKRDQGTCGMGESSQTISKGSKGCHLE